MTESHFIRDNQQDWKRLEDLLEAEYKDPDEMQRLFVKVSGDLSYARSYYARRAVKDYLNDLINSVFDSMRSKPPSKLYDRILHFYRSTLPVLVYHNRWSFYLSLCLFVAGVLIGALSLRYQPEFANEILGEGYVQMTETNINDGDPMAVYKDMNETDMFLGITINNIRVAFLTFVSGVLAGLGTLFVLVYNAVMVGVFQMFFFEKGLFWTSFLTIWIHGTIEILSIVVAGAAGFIMGRGILLPGSYTRGVSFANAAISAMHVLLSTVPLFIIAGFLEGFVTRQTALPTIIKVLIIVLSLALMLVLYVIRPMRYAQQKRRREKIYVDREMKANLDPSSRSPLVEGLFLLREQITPIIIKGLLPAVLVLSASMYWLVSAGDASYQTTIVELGLQESLLKVYGFFPLVIVALVFFWLVTVAVQHYRGMSSVLMTWQTSGIPILLMSVLVVLLMSYTSAWQFLFMIALPWPALAYVLIREEVGVLTGTKEAFRVYRQVALAALFTLVFHYGMIGFSQMAVVTIVTQLITWFSYEGSFMSLELLMTYIIRSLVVGLTLIAGLPIAFTMIRRSYDRVTASDLRERIDQMTVAL